MPENLAPRDASTDLVFDCRLKGLCAKVSSDPRELLVFVALCLDIPM